MRKIEVQRITNCVLWVCLWWRQRWRSIAEWVNGITRDDKLRTKWVGMEVKLNVISGKRSLMKNNKIKMNSFNLMTNTCTANDNKTERWSVTGAIKTIWKNRIQSIIASRANQGEIWVNMNCWGDKNWILDSVKSRLLFIVAKNACEGVVEKKWLEGEFWFHLVCVFFRLLMLAYNFAECVRPEGNLLFDVCSSTPQNLDTNNTRHREKTWISFLFGKYRTFRWKENSDVYLFWKLQFASRRGRRKDLVTCIHIVWLVEVWCCSNDEEIVLKLSAVNLELGKMFLFPKKMCDAVFLFCYDVVDNFHCYQ